MLLDGEDEGGRAPCATPRKDGRFPSAEPAKRGGPPTSRAQRRYLAEGKSLPDHPRRLLRSSSGLPYFRVQPERTKRNGCVLALSFSLSLGARLSSRCPGKPNRERESQGRAFERQRPDSYANGRIRRIRLMIERPDKFTRGTGAARPRDRKTNCDSAPDASMLARGE